MYLTSNTKILTEVGHYPLGEIEEKQIINEEGRSPILITNEGEQEAYNIKLLIQRQEFYLEGSGTIILADNSVVNITDLTLRAEIEIPILDEEGNELLNEEGEPITQTQINRGAILKPHSLNGGVEVEVVSIESLGNMPVYSINIPVFLTCGIVC